MKIVNKIKMFFMLTLVVSGVVPVAAKTEAKKDDVNVSERIKKLENKKNKDNEKDRKKRIAQKNKEKLSIKDLLPDGKSKLDKNNKAKTDELKASGKDKNKFEKTKGLFKSFKLFFSKYTRPITTNSKEKKENVSTYSDEVFLAAVEFFKSNFMGKLKGLFENAPEAVVEISKFDGSKCVHIPFSFSTNSSSIKESQKNSEKLKINLDAKEVVSNKLDISTILKYMREAFDELKSQTKKENTRSLNGAIDSFVSNCKKEDKYRNVDVSQLKKCVYAINNLILERGFYNQPQDKLENELKDVDDAASQDSKVDEKKDSMKKLLNKIAKDKKNSTKDKNKANTKL